MSGWEERAIEALVIFKDAWVLCVVVALAAAGFAVFSWLDDLSVIDPDYIDDIAQEDETQ